MKATPKLSLEDNDTGRGVGTAGSDFSSSTPKVGQTTDLDGTHGDDMVDEK